MNQDKILSTLDEFLSKNDYDSAKKYLITCLNQAKTTQNDKIILLLNNELMGLCRKLGERQQAINFAQDALFQIQKMNIYQNIGAATTYLNCATVYKAFGDAQRGIPLFEMAKNIYEQNLNPNDLRLAGLYNNMALSLVDLNRFDQADSLYQKALVVLKQNQNSKPEQAITYLNIASAAELKYGLEKGEKIINENLNQAMHLLEECKHQTDGNYAFVCDKCSSVFGYYGYFDYENKLKERIRRIYERA